jgi:uncharacterized membrane protein YcaP (DUF421 family)
MESILRGLAVYLFLLGILRVAGKRTLAQSTPFDFALLLIISETTQQAMLGSDYSLTNCFLLITTLVGTSILLSFVKEYSPTVERWIDDVPTILLQNGLLNHNAMKKLRVDEADIMRAARNKHGLERMEQIRYAIAEASGDISIIPNEIGFSH